MSNLNFTRKELESRIISMQKFRLSVMEEFEIKLMEDWMLMIDELATTKLQVINLRKMNACSVSEAVIQNEKVDILCNQKAKLIEDANNLADQLEVWARIYPLFVAQEILNRHAALIKELGVK